MTSKMITTKPYAQDQLPTSKEKNQTVSKAKVSKHDKASADELAPATSKKRRAESTMELTTPMQKRKSQVLSRPFRFDIVMHD